MNIDPTIKPTTVTTMKPIPSTSPMVAGTHPGAPSFASLRPCTPNRTAQMAATNEMRFTITVHVSSGRAQRSGHSGKLEIGEARSGLYDGDA
jgi:hypothetical protein